MKYLYKISSSYDGFTPQKIEQRLEQDKYLTYNWREYFDELKLGDIIFTYFKGRDVKKGIYLISKVSKILENKRVLGRVLRYDQKEPLIPPEEFKKYQKDIITRPFGSVYVIPPFLDIVFEDYKKAVTISEIEIGEEIKCHECFKNNIFNCAKCPIFNPKFLIKWDNEVYLNIHYLEGITSPFWIITRQGHWTKKTITEHPISRVFYIFKRGYELYARLFAFGIIKAIENNPNFKRVRFNYILGIPLSPEKKERGELDRVSEICKILEEEMGVKYLENELSLSHPISRKEYRVPGFGKKRFLKDYYEYLKLKKHTSLDNKTILIIDDVITDGATIKATSKKIKDNFPNCHIYAATAGIMAKKWNMTLEAIKKFRHNSN